MAVLLQDLGDVASIDAGQLRIRMQERSAETIVTDLVEAFTPLCAEKGVSLVGRAPALRLTCDPNRAQQVLGNLVANALKFTPRGGTITIEAAPSGGEVRFSVTDTGSGISPEACEHVFERYWRGKERDLTKGVGLGLFIAKSIVDAHGGKIWVESTRRPWEHVLVHAPRGAARPGVDAEDGLASRGQQTICAGLSNDALGRAKR